MGTESKPKPTDPAKERKKFWGTFALAFLGCATAVGDGIRAYHERQQDVEKAARVDAARVQGDKQIQETLLEGLTELEGQHEEDYEVLADRLDVLEEENVELRIEVRAAQLAMETRGIIDGNLQEKMLIEAAEAEAEEESVDIDVDAESVSKPTAVIEKTTKRITDKKKRRKAARKDRKKLDLQFAPPEPVYQLQQRQLPALPPPPKAK